MLQIFPLCHGVDVLIHSALLMFHWGIAISSNSGYSRLLMAYSLSVIGLLYRKYVRGATKLRN